MRFQVLGPLSVVGEAGCVELRASKLNSLLAALLLRGGQSASTGYLSDAVWDAQAPDAARAALHTAVLRLRRLFDGLGFPHEAIATTPQGYRLIADAGDLDLIAFRQARAAAERIADPHARRVALRGALALWATPPTLADPLLNVPSEMLRRDVVPVLVEEWKQTAERCYELDLRLGEGRDILRDLREATAAFPTHEGFARQLAEALWRSERQHEALAEIRRIRDLLRNELGLCPGEALQALEVAILRGEAPAPVPRLQAIPGQEQEADDLACPDLRRLRDRAASGALLVGRHDELALLDSVMAPGSSGGIAVISGPPGIGKSAFAASVIDRVAARFPGGVTYHCGTHTTGFTLLASVQPRLVVVENAGDMAAEDYRGLARRGSWILLVSRYCHRDLGGDHGVVGVRLRPLDTGDRLKLGRHLIADASTDGQALARLADLTCGFPSALTLAAGRLRLSRDRDIACFVTWLAQDPIRRLSASRESRASIALAFDEHLGTLRPSTRSAFLTLALHPDGDVDVATAAAILRTDEMAAELALEELVDACVADVDSSGRYSIPELIRAVASCLARRHPNQATDNRPLLSTADRRRA